MATDFMGDSANHKSAAVVPQTFGVSAAFPASAGDTPATTEPVRHIFVHIPFCARICPYCAFYKDLLDRSQTWRFCEAVLREIEEKTTAFLIAPKTIYVGGGTPTALSTSQLEFLLRGFHERLDLSSLEEWTIEANPGSVSTRKAALLCKLGVNRVSLGVQSWDNTLLKILGREHSAEQAAQSFHILRAAGCSNINIDLMFGLPGQTVRQWQQTVEKTILLRPEHVSAYCLTYEEDTEFFLRQSRGELEANPDTDADFFEVGMSILEEAGYEHYEISNYARAGFASVHNRAYWSGKDYIGVGPSAFSTVGMRRWQNLSDYRAYADRVLSALSPTGSTENLTNNMKRAERIALSLRTRDGVSAVELQRFAREKDEFIMLGLLQESNGKFLLTQKGKSLADSVAAAFV